MRILNHNKLFIGAFACASAFSVNVKAGNFKEDIKNFFKDGTKLKNIFLDKQEEYLNSIHLVGLEPNLLEREYYSPAKIDYVNLRRLRDSILNVYLHYVDADYYIKFFAENIISFISNKFLGMDEFDKIDSSKIETWKKAIDKYCFSDKAHEIAERIKISCTSYTVIDQINTLITAIEGNHISTIYKAIQPIYNMFFVKKNFPYYMELNLFWKEFADYIQNMYQYTLFCVHKNHDSYCHISSEIKKHFYNDKHIKRFSADIFDDDANELISILWPYIDNFLNNDDSFRALCQDIKTICKYEDLMYIVVTLSKLEIMRAQFVFGETKNDLGTDIVVFKSLAAEQLGMLSDKCVVKKFLIEKTQTIISEMEKGLAQAKNYINESRVNKFHYICNNFYKAFLLGGLEKRYKERCKDLLKSDNTDLIKRYKELQARKSLRDLAERNHLEKMKEGVKTVFYSKKYKDGQYKKGKSMESLRELGHKASVLTAKRFQEIAQQVRNHLDMNAMEKCPFCNATFDRDPANTWDHTSECVDFQNAINEQAYDICSDCGRILKGSVPEQDCPCHVWEKISKNNN